MKSVNAYFTVEAALVLPVVMGTILFVIYMLLFQYDRCLLEQDLGGMVLWGSRLEESDREELEKKVQERISGMYQEKYAAWNMTALEASLEKNKFSARGAGQVAFPLPGWNFWGAGNLWRTRADYTASRLSPVTFIRLCRKVKN